MKALLSRAPGGPETLELAELPDPVPGPGQLLVGVKACAINYPDVLIIEDKYQFRPERPFAPGGEIAGVVEAVGEGVSGWAAGDRLIAMLGHGGLAEKVVIPAAMARAAAGRAQLRGRLGADPDLCDHHPRLARPGQAEGGRDPARARRRGRRRPGRGRARQGLWRARGRRGLVGGESRGGQGGGRRRGDRLSARAVRQGRRQGAGAAVQGGGRRRTARTWSTIRSAATIPRRRCARSPGRGGCSSSASRPASRSCRSTSPCSRAATCAASSGAPSRRAIPKANAAHVRTLFRLWDEGKIAPKVSRTWPLAQGGEAIAHMAARQAVGKLVVTMD